MGKANEHKMFCIGNNFSLGCVEILVARKWIDQIFDVKRVNNRLMVIKLLIGKWIVAIVSTYEQELAEDVKDKFYEDLISLVSKVNENTLFMIGGALNGTGGLSVEREY